MTVRDLFEKLESMMDREMGDVEIKLALQPTYPMIGSIRNVCVEHGDDDEPEAVWFACSDNTDYGVPCGVWDDDEIFYGDEED